MKCICRIFFNYFPLVVLLAIPHSLSAQQEDWKEIVKKNIELKEEISKIVADTVSLTRYQNDFKSLLSEIDGRVLSIERQIEEIRSLSDSKYISKLTQTVDSLEVIMKGLDSVRRDLRTELSNRKKTQSDLERELSNLDVYSRIKMDGVYEKYRMVLSKRYSDITDMEIDQISYSIDSFSYRPDFVEYKKRVNAAVQNRSLYLASNNALNNVYNAEEIAGLRSKLSKILLVENDNVPAGEFKLSEEQYSELDSLDIKLLRYRNGVNELKSIVAKVNNDEGITMHRISGNKEACIAIMSSIVLPNNEDTKRIYERYFNLIPYLKQMIEEYWKELQENPLDFPGMTEQKIEQM